MKLLVLLPLVVMFGCQTNKQFSDQMRTKIVHDIQRDDMNGRLHMLFRGVDNQNWNDVKQVLASEVELDMGNGPKKMTADEVIEVWKKATKGLDGVHHQVGNYGIEVDKKTARLMFVGTATHYKKGKTTTYFGSYEVHMQQPGNDETNWAWEVTKFKYQNKFKK